MATILIIDDDPQISGTMESLMLRRNHESLCAATLAEAKHILENERPDVVFLDIRLPDGSGLELLPGINAREDPPEVIILTGQGDSDGAEVAFQGGAWDYLIKPSSLKDIVLSLERALKYRAQKKENTKTQALNLEHVVGLSATMRSVFDKVAMAASSDANVLVNGETGTGKELIARTIHENSARAENQFVVVDCASLTETLLESTLFGHRKGAFTGAHSDYKGLVRLADKGSLFLDEIGEMPMNVQKSFLRVLQERRFRPVGETREVSSDFRLLAATNKDLEHMVQEGRFREDLLFRIKTMRLELPPLRDRLDDIKSLAVHHVRTLCERYQTTIKGFDPDFFDILRQYDWPGNVRELFNIIERAFVAAGDDPTLFAKHLPHKLRIRVTQKQIERTERAEAPPTSEPAAALPGESAPEPDSTSASPENVPTPLALRFSEQGMPTLKEFKVQAEKAYLESLWIEKGGDVQNMISASGLSRSHLYALLKKHGLSLQL